MREGRWHVKRGAAVALALTLAASTGSTAPSLRTARVVQFDGAHSFSLETAKPRAAWASALPALQVTNRNTSERTTLRLYGEDGQVDRAALRDFMRVASSSRDHIEPLDPRLVQLVVRAAYHWNGAPIIIISATRKGAHGKHGAGGAIDFQLEGVRASALAAYARTYPRAGIGIYTHPKTQYVHLDVRDRSYHWIDGSPPRVTWRERLLPDPTQAKRDAGWTVASDLPETAGR